jgi:hypothetical protein
MFSDNAQSHNSQSHRPNFDAHEPRFRTMLTEVWQDWFEALSEVAYQTHRACEFFAENNGPSSGRFGPFDFRFTRGPSAGPNGSVDMEKLKECLQSMEPIQAAQVMHAVQMMQAVEAMLKKQRARADETEGTAW